MPLYWNSLWLDTFHLRAYTHLDSYPHVCVVVNTYLWRIRLSQMNPWIKVCARRLRVSLALLIIASRVERVKWEALPPAFMRKLCRAGRECCATSIWENAAGECDSETKGIIKKKKPTSSPVSARQKRSGASRLAYCEAGEKKRWTSRIKELKWSRSYQR